MKSSLLSFILVLGMIPELTAAISTTVYQTSFEAPSFTRGLPLRGQDNWEMYHDGEAISIVTTNARTGDQCLRIDGSELEQTGPNSSTAFGFSTALLKDTTPTPPPIVELTAYVRLDGSQIGADGAATNDLISANFAAVVDLGSSTPPRALATFLVSSAGRIFTWGSLPEDRYRYSAAMAFGNYNKLVLRIDFLTRTVVYFANDIELGSVRFDPEIRSDRLAGGYLVMSAQLDPVEVPYHYDPKEYSAYFDDYSIVSVPLSPINAVVDFASTNILTDEFQQTARVVLNRRGFVSAPLRLRVSTSNETAIAGMDYEQVSTLVTFAAGQTNSFVEIPIQDDFFAEPDKSFSVHIGELPPGVSSTMNIARVFIRDDERPGSIDYSWQSDLGLPPLGTDQSMFLSSIVQPDGKVLVALVRNASNFSRVEQRVVRINPDGTLDPTFHSIAVNLGNGINFFLMPDGTIIVAEDTLKNGIGNVKKLRRYHSDGTSDTSFTANVECPVPGPWVVGLPTGKMLLLGSRRYAGDPNRVNGAVVNNLVRLNPNGSLDKSFKAPSDLEFYTWQSRIPLKVLPDGELLVGSESTHPLRRLTEDGSMDGTFAIPEATVSPEVNSYPIVTDLMVTAEGKILAAGLFDTINGKQHSNIVELSFNGTVDETFRSGSGFEGGLIETLDLLPAGQVLVNTYSGRYDGESVNGPFVLNPDGSMDRAFTAALIQNRSGNVPEPEQAYVSGVLNGFPLFGSRFGLGRLRLNLPLRIVSQTYYANGAAHILANALAPHRYTLQSTENLTSWIDIVSQQATTNRIELTDSFPNHAPIRLYRVREN